jgi:hypothetical protein
MSWVQLPLPALRVSQGVPARPVAKLAEKVTGKERCVSWLTRHFTLESPDAGKPACYGSKYSAPAPLLESAAWRKETRWHETIG